MNSEMNFFNNNKAKILIAAIFALFGVLFMTIGFFKTLFIVFLAVIGFFVGYIVDDKELVRRFLNTYLGK